jgi:hypothetical protein
MKTRQGPDFVFSPELFEAAGNVLGRRDSVALGKAMRSTKTRARLRAEQYRILMQQKTPPASDEGSEPPPQAPAVDAGGRGVRPADSPSRN